MTEHTKSYTLTKVQQLVDLNHDVINFRLKFQVKAQKEGNVFQMVVVSQSQLDSEDDLVFKDVPSSITGEVHNNNNVYQNYFMILRSATPITVDVTILFEVLPEYIEQDDNVELYDEESSNTESYDTIKKAILACAIFAIMYILYTKFGDQLFKSGKKDSGGSLLSKLKDMPIE